nr:MAG TPA: hypothetical protein [Caudoviricetes sp.]
MNGTLSFISYTLAALASLCFVGGIAVLSRGRG